MSFVLPRRATRGAALSCGLVIAALLTALAADASGARVSWKGIQKVRLGMSEKALRDKLGRPSSTKATPQPGTTIYVYRRQKLQVKLNDGRVGAVYTTARSH